jgi:acetolactate synthase I/II/III large subunit
MLEIGRPDLDWVALATGTGVPASRAADCESVTRQLQRGLAEARPHLIEVVL